MTPGTRSLRAHARPMISSAKPTQLPRAKADHLRLWSLRSLHPDPTSGGLGQAFTKVAAGEADVFQFSIIEVTENNDVGLARSLRDYRGKPVI
jgi:hypothetical protein